MIMAKTKKQIDTRVREIVKRLDKLNNTPESNDKVIMNGSGNDKNIPLMVDCSGLNNEEYRLFKLSIGDFFKTSERSLLLQKWKDDSEIEVTELKAELKELL